MKGALTSGNVELTALPEVKEEESGEPQLLVNGQDKPVGQTLDDELTAVIKAVRELPPSLPSICFFTFLNTYQG